MTKIMYYFLDRRVLLVRLFLRIFLRELLRLLFPPLTPLSEGGIFHPVREEEGLGFKFIFPIWSVRLLTPPLLACSTPAAVYGIINYTIVL